MSKQWKLGEDLFPDDTILDPITFDNIILDLHCGSRYINEDEVWKAFWEEMNVRMEDAKFLVERNINEIIKKAKEGRE